MLLKPLRISAEVTMSVFNRGQKSICVQQNTFGESVVYINLIESCLLLRLPFLITVRKVQEFSIKMLPP